jgi:hypothetical protein
MGRAGRDRLDHAVGKGNWVHGAQAKARPFQQRAVLVVRALLPAGEDEHVDVAQQGGQRLTAVARPEQAQYNENSGYTIRLQRLT